jgi:23S rRNA (uracil1939-C5)-methyltransferase
MSSFITVDIEKIVYGGRGLGHVGGKVIFVPFTVPGDRAVVDVSREKKNYCEGKLKALERASPSRSSPFCPLFGKCGGCHLQPVPYEAQVKWKEEVVEGFLRPLEERERIENYPMIPSPRDQAYRTRAQLQGGKVEGRDALGFYEIMSHRLIAVKECPLLHAPANDILAGLQQWLALNKGEASITGADIHVAPDEARGIIRLKAGGAVLPGLAERLGRGIPGVKGCFVEGTRRGAWGELTLLETRASISGERPLRMRTSFESFSQINPYQNWNLIQRVIEWAELSGKERVVDLFCGSGNLTLPLAQRSRRVWGIDHDPRAIEQARENARINEISNCSFIPDTARRGIEEGMRAVDGVDLIVLDPPRAGAWEALQPLASLRPQKVLYVSCEPPTFVRDVRRLAALGYALRRVQPLDMFPHTYHIELVAELSVIPNRPSPERKKGRPAAPGRLPERNPG